MNKMQMDEYLDYVNTFGIVPGLDNMRQLISELSNPLEGIKVIHVAGTNGKGSISSMLAHIIAQTGRRVGIYNSPALFNVCETIRFSMSEEKELKCIEENEYYRCLEAVILKAKHLNLQKTYPTKFEIETATAFVAFKEHNCEFAIIETGMGGKEDATNVIDNPIATVIASISMDHMAYLGNTIEEIAKNKCGIFKRNVPAFISASNNEIKETIARCAAQMECEVSFSDEKCLSIKEHTLEHVLFDYKGIGNVKINTGALYQTDNVMTVIDLILKLTDKGLINANETDIKKGIDKFVWKGRFEIIDKNPLVIADGAHNPAAARLLAQTIEGIDMKKKPILLMAVYKDKAYKEILKIMKNVSDSIICTDVGEARALKAEILFECAKEYYSKTILESNFSKALEKGKEIAMREDRALLCFGTLSMMKYID